MIPQVENALSRPPPYSVTVYYEDTDFTGYVYHANYLKYFERAREELLGVEQLVALYRERGIGFVVYKAELNFREPAYHGDILEVRTSGGSESPYRAVFDHTVVRRGSETPLVQGKVQMVAVDTNGKLVALPEPIAGWLSTGRFR